MAEAKDSKDVEFGNLVVRFGDKVLLDHFDEIVLPAFQEKYERTYSDTRYFFEKVDLLHLGNVPETKIPLLVIVGRFIKDGVLRRDQVYVDGALQKKPGKMQSSPSALFMLMLHNHRLVYLKETVDAPTKETFRSTLLQFLKRKHGAVLKAKKNDVDDIYATRIERREAKEKLEEAYGTPTVQLISLSSEESVREFINRYKTLSQVRITFSATNDENPMGSFFAQLKKAKEDVGSDSSSLTHSSRSGLDKEEAIDQIAEATEQGINKVQLSGIDEAGDRLLGNNVDFRLKKTLDKVSADPVKAAGTLLKAFNGLLKDGIIKVEATTAKTVARIEEIFDEHWD